jgi:phage protein D
MIQTFPSTDYWDIEILASRQGILPSQLIAIRERQKETQDKYNHSEKGRARSEKYEKSEKGKARAERYAKSEKGKANARRKTQRDIASGKNAERCRRYWLRKKAEENQQEDV